ncbi:MAG: 4a-hydroxytetrahydrobiopterin dehydratase [Pseudonocardiales bacterium]
MATPLSAEIITDALNNLPNWSGTPDKLSRTVTLTDEQHEQVQRQVAISADAMDHHPEVSRTREETTFVLSTHSVGGVTSLDIALASEISTQVRIVLGHAPPPLPEIVMSSDAITESRFEGHEESSSGGEEPAAKEFLGVPAGAQGTPQVPLPDTAPAAPEPGLPEEQERR